MCSAPRFTPSCAPLFRAESRPSSRTVTFTVPARQTFHGAVRGACTPGSEEVQVPRGFKEVQAELKLALSGSHTRGGRPVHVWAEPRAGSRPCGAKPARLPRASRKASRGRLARPCFPRAEQGRPREPSALHPSSAPCCADPVLEQTPAARLRARPMHHASHPSRRVHPAARAGVPTRRACCARGRCGSSSSTSVRRASSPSTPVSSPDHGLPRSVAARLVEEGAPTASSYLGPAAMPEHQPGRSSRPHRPSLRSSSQRCRSRAGSERAVMRCIRACDARALGRPSPACIDIAGVFCRALGRSSSAVPPCRAIPLRRISQACHHLYALVRRRAMPPSWPTHSAPLACC